jgi:hypothetical protein
MFISAEDFLILMISIILKRLRDDPYNKVMNISDLTKTQQPLGSMKKRKPQPKGMRNKTTRQNKGEVRTAATVINSHCMFRDLQQQHVWH